MKNLLKILIVAVGSFLIAGIVTLVIALAITELPALRGVIDRGNYENLLIEVFFLAGLVLSLGAGYLLISKKRRGRVRKGQK